MHAYVDNPSTTPPAFPENRRLSIASPHITPGRIFWTPFGNGAMRLDGKKNRTRPQDCGGSLLVEICRKLELCFEALLLLLLLLQLLLLIFSSAPAAVERHPLLKLQQQSANKTRAEKQHRPPSIPRGTGSPGQALPPCASRFRTPKRRPRCGACYQSWRLRNLLPAAAPAPAVAPWRCLGERRARLEHRWKSRRCASCKLRRR